MKHKHKKTKAPAIRSARPEPAIRSEQGSEWNIPDLDITFPDLDITFPELNIKVPELNIKVPDIDINVPDLDLEIMENPPNVSKSI